MQTQPVRTGDQSLVREINLSVVMNSLRERAPISRAALADVTGLNKSTVSSLVNELMTRQFIREVGLTSTGAGRPSVMLELNPDAGAILSAEIGVDFISVLCANFGADVIWRHRQPVASSSSRADILDCVLRLLQQAATFWHDICAGSGPILGVAVGVPGLVDARNSTVRFIPNLGWEDVSLVTVLRDCFPDVPVFVNNDANSAALGETFFGAARGFDDVLYISAGVGLGGAIVRNGNVVKGAGGFAAEFGHMTMDVHGQVCRCGNRGCWETQVSQRALFWLIHEASPDVEPHQAELSMERIVADADAGDAIVLAALAQVGEHLGVGIASLVNALNPDVVVLGGTLWLAHDYLIPTISRIVQQRALRWNVHNLRMAPAAHGVDSCLMGGIALVYQAILEHPQAATRLAV